MTASSSSLLRVDENARRAFEAAWRKGAPPAIEVQVAGVAETDMLGTLEELVQIDLEMRWKARATRPGASPHEDKVGPMDDPSPPRVEEYLQRFPTLAQPDVLLRLVKQEFRVRQAWGDRLWNAADGQPLAVFDAKELVLAVAFVPHSSRLAAATADGRVRIWDVVTKEQAVAIKGHQRSIEALVCSPDGKRLVTCTGWGEKSVRVWDTETGQELLTLAPAMAFPNGLAFTGDGSRLVAVGDSHLGKPGGTIAIWDTRPALLPVAPETVVVDLRDKKQRPLFDVFLTVHNRTTEPITLYLRFMQREGGNESWLPSGKTFAKYTLAPGKKTNLSYKGTPIAANRLRFWAETPNGDVIADQRNSDMRLVPLDGYLAPERQTYTLTLPRK